MQKSINLSKLQQSKDCSVINIRVFCFFTAFDLKNEYLFFGRVLIADFKPGIIFHYDVILSCTARLFTSFIAFLIFHKLQTIDLYNLG